MRIPRLGSAARAMLAAIILFVCASVSLADDYPYIPDDFIATTPGFWAGQGEDHDIYTRTLTGAVMPPLVADLDGDGTNEIIVFDSASIKIYSGIGMTQVGSYAIKPAPIGAYVFDWNDDGKEDVVFINGTAGGNGAAPKALMALSFNGTAFNLTEHSHAALGALGQASFFCDTTNRRCVLAQSRFYGELPGAQASCSIFSKTFSYHKANASSFNVVTSCVEYWCFPFMGTAQVADYDKDGDTELIFSALSNSKLYIDFLWFNSSSDSYKVERTITTTASMEPGTGHTCTHSGFNYSSYFTAPSVYDYDTGGNLEVVLAYQKSIGEFEIKAYDYAGSTIGTYPGFSTADGNILSGIMRGNFFEDDQNAFCVLGQDTIESSIDVLCGSVTTGASITNREYTADYSVYSALRSWPNYQMLSHASNEDEDGYDEVVTGFGVIDLELPYGGVCSATAFCDASLDWENPKSNAVVIPVDYQGVGRHDLIMHTGTNIWYFDDGYTFTAPTIESYYVDPCLGSTWKINTSVEARVVGASEDGSSIQGRAVLYYGTAAAVDSGWTAFLPEGTTLTFSMKANTTVGSGVLRLMLNDSNSLTDYEDLSFSVGADGVEFGDCSTEEEVGAEGEAGAGTNVSQLPSSGNQIEELVNTLEQASGLGSTLLWVIFMLACSIAVVVAAIRGGWGGGAMGMMLLIFNGGLLVMGASLGFISTGVVVVLALVCIAALGLWVKDAFAGGGA